MTTNVPRVSFGPLGFTAPPQSEILAGELADLSDALGGNLNVTNLETPQGQLASSMSAVIGNADDDFCNITNMVDPAFASGRMQDAIARIYFLTRKPSQPTVVQCVCTGLPSTVIPENAIAQAEDGNRYICTLQGTIPANGTITLPFNCVIDGPVPCPADTLNQIYQAIPGWDSINNPDDGVLGTNTESRQAFEDRRAASVALNSEGFVSSIRGAVLAVDGVLDAYVTENDTNAPATIGGVSLIANSLYVAAVGGDQDDIAQAIWSKKAPGCSYNGNTTVTVFDTRYESVPLPSYQVSFEIPDDLPTLFKVTLQNNTQVPSNATTQIQDALIAAFSGADGGARAIIGSTIFASRFYQAVALLGSWAQILSLQVGSVNTPSAVVTGTIAANTLNVTAVGSGALAVGQTISDPAGNIAPGTRIIALGTGSGGIGTYTVNIAQAITSEVITSALASLNFVTVRIDQVPTIDANNIVVAFV